MQNILVMESDIDSDLEEDELLLHHLIQKRFLRPGKTNPSSDIYTPSDLVHLSIHKLKQLCHTTHEYFQQLAAIIQEDAIFQNSLTFKQRDPAIELTQLESNGDGASLGKLGILFGVSHGAIVLYTQHIIKYGKEYIMWPIPIKKSKWIIPK
ncbi:hypothetical protein O181_076663 [Austropuccinia psidii MF-1]|uniref:Uncharacterized protein n=1 Tax=Austropuccinia psidii MF-1 TaxID=1389203 RepID=A0A9Q3ID00_9BASI|nr:hypothetical protein [Austropuccinia psidii MF-1]